jgi:hypothetical protein
MTDQLHDIYLTDEEIQGMEDYTKCLEGFSQNMRLQTRRMDDLVLYILFGDQEESNHDMGSYRVDGDKT